MSGEQAARPRRVTVAGVMAAAACALLVVTLFESMARVRSAEMRDSVDAFLRESPGAGLQLDVDGVLDLLRAVVLLSGALAAAGAVLAVYTLRRHRGARIGLTVIAVLLLFSATFVAGLLPVVVAVAATMMWSREARDWFDGRAAGQAGGAEGTSAGLAAWQPDRPVPPPERQTSPAPHFSPYGATSQVSPPGAWPSPGATSVQAGRRPTTVTIAAWLTWVFSALTVFAFSLMVLVILAARTELLAALQRDPTIEGLNLTSRQILAVLWVVSAVAIFWSLAAIALAVLAYRRINAGRIGLMVSAAVSGALCLSLVGVGWPHAMAAFATLGLLVGGPANRWYSHRDTPAPPRLPGPPQQGPPQPGPPQPGPRQPPGRVQPPGPPQPRQKPTVC
jgi:hypothetical protein